MSVISNNFDTVAAVSTPRGKGGIAVVRISGENTEKIVEKCFVPYGKPILSRAPRSAVYGKIVNGDDIIDTGICVLFANGASFTGEPMAEISCHGGILVTSRVLEAVIAAGASAASPGEFTKRAFINGKLTLSEAEAVGKLIDADTVSKAELASGAARGNLSRSLSALDGELYGVMTALWAAVDYPEEDVGSEGEDNIYPVVCRVLEGVRRLADTYKTGRAVSDGIRTVICGKPNVGKSSLYNALMGEDRAIVTDVAGTTRDFLEDTADVGGITLVLTDTAGIRDSHDEIEKIGIERALTKLEEAELVICMFDMSRGLDSEDEEVLAAAERSAAEKICVINKCDLERKLDDAALKRLGDVFENIVEVSLKDRGAEDGKGGAAALAGKISEMYNSEKLNVNTDAVVWDAAQKASLDRCAEMLAEAKRELECGAPLDVVGVICEGALGEMRMADGAGVSEDIIDGIFSRFCVGK